MPIYEYRCTKCREVCEVLQKATMIRFDDILEKASSYISEKELLALQKAYVFAGKAHKGQVRRSGEPYLVHPLEVADYLADMALDRTTLVAGLLHDVLEDTDVTAAASSRRPSAKRWPPWSRA